MGKASKLPSSTTPQAIKQFKVQSSAWGGAIPVLYGETRVAGNIIAAWHFTSEVKSGGIGSMSSGKAGSLGALKEFDYHVALVYALGEGGPSIAHLWWFTPDNFDVGLATPGHQAISVQTAGTAQGKKNLQPLAGIERAGWKAKRVLVFGEDDVRLNGYRWRHANWRRFASTRFVSSPTETPLDALATGTAAYSQYVSDFGEAYKGTAYLVAARLALGSNAGMANWNMPGRILCASGDVYAGGFNATSSTMAGVRDADPAVIWLDILANPKHGLGWWDGIAGHDMLLRALPDYATTHPWGAGTTGATTPSVTARGDSWSAYCRANDILLSPCFDTQAAAADILKTLAEETQTAVVVSEGLVKMIPYADVASSSARTGVTFTPTNDRTVYTTGTNIAVQYDLSIDDFLPGQNKDPVEIERKSIVPDHGSAGLFNDIRIEFQDRYDGYSTAVAQAKDEASINAIGLLSAPPFTYHEISDANEAQDVAERHLQRLGTVRNIYRFTLGWRFARLEPMDIVTIPGEAISLALTGTRIGVRITQVSEDKSGQLAMEAEEYPRAFASRAPTTPPTSTTIEDMGEVIAGGLWTVNQIFGGTNPYYIDITGTSDSQFFPITELPAESIEASDGIVAVWSVRLGAIQFPGTPTTGPGDTANHAVFKGQLRLRLVIDGTPQEDMTVLFEDATAVGAIRTVSSAIGIKPDTRFSVEITRLDASGFPFAATNTLDVDYARDCSAQWTLHLLPAG